ncbi:MAG: hypothetical protein IJ381_02185 [Clostridia bacterium]|nr:hypothetical protein [Clostridia bacterium]
MNPAIKVVVALLVAALIAVIGMIMLTNQDAGEPEAEAATTPVTTNAPSVNTQAEVQPEESTKPEETAQESETSVSEEAQEEAQGTMYEGALAGLSEDEIARMALAEEQNHATGEINEDETDTGTETGEDEAGD